MKSRVSKMPFPAFWGEILCMEQVRNEVYPVLFFYILLPCRWKDQIRGNKKDGGLSILP